MPPRFFITHSWKDIEFARKLTDDLREQGLDGFFDAYSIQPGDSIPARIARGLEECDVYVPMLSPAALASRWSELEINTAITLERNHHRPRIIPVIAETCQVPILLQSTLYINFVGRYDEALEELLTKGFGVTPIAVSEQSAPPAPVEKDREDEVEIPEPPKKSPRQRKPGVEKWHEEFNRNRSVASASLDDVETVYLEALEAFHLEKWQEAVDGFHQVVAVQPDYEGVAEKLQRAERALREGELSVLYADATQAIEANDWRLAIDKLQELVDMDDGYKDATARLDSAHKMLEASDLDAQADEALAAKKWGDAVRALESLLTMVPDYPDAATKLAEAKRWAQLPDLYRRALKLMDAKQWVDAKTLLEQVQSVDANYRESKSLLARVRDSALAELYNLASKAIDAKEWGQAKALLEQIQSIAPNYRETTQQLELVINELTPRKITNSKDDKEMLLVPAGEFVMGDGAKDAPVHQVYLDAFYISRYPVTNAEYKKFKSNWEIPQGKENHPVVNVSWQDAVDYCKWAGGRLPTEAEWEKAASWDQSKKEKRVYPWGKDFDKNKCNTSKSGIGGTTPVDKYSPQGDSAYGIADMAGNVWEWCADWYGETYCKDSPPQNSQGPDSGTYRVVRGGSYSFDQDLARCAFRNWGDPDFIGDILGFRLVLSPV
jgi:formylglycine-generating enzyme required for sulfatase activity